MLRGFFERRALRQWTKSTEGQVLRAHGHDFFWAADAPFAYLDEEQKLDHCRLLHSNAIEIMASNDPVLRVREAIAGRVVQFAELMSAGLSPESKAGNVVYETPYLSAGLRPHIERIADFVDELGMLRFEDPDTTQEDIVSYCTTRACLLLFHANGLNTLSISLEDRVRQRGEWYRAFVQAAMIAAEDHHRENLGLPSLIPGTAGGLVYGSFMNYVIAGEPDPFFSWTKAFPDRFLFGRGPVPNEADGALDSR